MDQLQKSKVIAIGKRGGKIIGYKGGEPIYLKDDDGSGKTNATKDMFKPKGKGGAFNVQKLADHEQELKDMNAKTHGKYFSGLDMFSIPDQNMHGFYTKPSSNIEAVQLKVASSILDIAGLSHSEFIDASDSLVEHDTKKIGLTTKIKWLFDTKEMTNLGFSQNDSDKMTTHSNLVAMLQGSFKDYSVNPDAQKDIMRSLAETCFDSLLLHAVGVETPIISNYSHKSSDGTHRSGFIQNGQAFEVENSQPSYIKSEDTNSPVLSSVYSVIGSTEELCRDFGASVVEIVGHMKANPQLGMEAKEIAVRGLIGSLATPMGRAMGVKSFQEKTASALGNIVSLEDNLIAFAKDVLKQRLSQDEIEKMFNGNVSMPVAEGDKPKPKPVPTTDKQLKLVFDQVDSTVKPHKQLMKKEILELFKSGAVQDVSPLHGSSQGGILVSFADGKKIVLKKTKELKTEQVSSLLMDLMLEDSLGYDSTVFCHHIKQSDTQGKIPAEHNWIFAGDSVVMSDYVPNKGTIPKKGAQIEAKLNKDQKAELVALGMASWCVSDSDAHGGNFIITEGGQLMRVDMGQSGIYSHLDQNAENFHFSPNPNPIALNELLTYYAGEKTGESPAMDIDFNHPSIIKALSSLEASSGMIGSMQGIGGLAKSRSKQVRQHFEKMITSAMQKRSGDSSYTFKFGEDKPLPAWSNKHPDGSEKKANKPYHFKKNFSDEKFLESAGSGVNKAKIVRNGADGAKYVVKEFTGNKKMSGLAEATASNIAHQLLPPTVSSTGQLYYQAVPAFVVNDGDTGTMKLVQQKQFNKGNLEGQNVSNLPTQNKQQILATSLVRWLVGDHDGHTGQYMYSSPMKADAKPDIIAVDFGNAWKHSASEPTDFLGGYFNFNPQSPPPKADAKLYAGIMSGKENIVELLDNPQIKSIIENVEASKDSFLEMADDYFALVGNKSQSMAKKGREKYEKKLNSIRQEWESWVGHLISESGTKGTYTVEDGFKITKSMSVQPRQSNSVYKGIRTVKEESLMDDEGTLTELALDVCSRFAKLCSMIYKDQQISRDTMANSESLSTLYLQFPDLNDEFDEILENAESRLQWQ